MSLYRQAGRTSGRTLVIAAVVALVVGLAGGYAIGRATAPKPTLADKVADLRSSLGPAQEGIELSATEYPQAVRDGRIVAPTEYAAAQSDVQRARDAISGARADVHVLDAPSHIHLAYRPGVPLTHAVWKHGRRVKGLL